MIDVDYDVEGDSVRMSKEEFDRIQATIRTLEDKDVLKQFEESEEDISDGRTKDWKEAKKQL